jgi:predicted RNA-binding Zn ribbon-like protein
MTCQLILLVTHYTAGVLPSWVPPIETKPAPAPLLLVQAFVNTVENDVGTDLLAAEPTANGWLWAAGLVPDGVELTPMELRRVRELREALRSLLESNAGDGPPAPRHLQLLGAAADDSVVRLHIEPDGEYLIRAEPEAVDPVSAIGTELLLIVRDAQRGGTWARLKACSNSECRWAYYDRSHSRRGRWCDMAVCGNRVKNRALRARRR